MIRDGELAARLGAAGAALRLELGDDLTSLRAVSAAMLRSLGAPSLPKTYLLAASSSGVIPFPEEVVALHRDWMLRGNEWFIQTVIRRARAVNRLALTTPRVRIAGGILIDVHDTANTRFMTGIQRVVRSTLAVWMPKHSPELVVWAAGFGAPRTLTGEERQLALGTTGAGAGTSVRSTEIVIPFESTWVLPEIATDPGRAGRIHSIARFSMSHTTAIGHDCIPITSPETAGAGMPGGFAHYLAALASFDRIVTTSSSSSTEFEGWRTMLSGAGLAGPVISPVALPTESQTGEPNETLVEAVGVRPGSALVLAVGSHEPRKNHLALVQAAERVWRAGYEFTLVLVGGNSWNHAAFDDAVAAARDDGRSIIALSAASDAVVWALYRRARFTVFPSLNEGFGLPVVESISAGTPVITSNFGSMRECAEGFGGLLVDPRNDDALAQAIETLLSDDALLRVLTNEASSAPRRSWDQYADALWASLSRETT